MTFLSRTRNIRPISPGCFGRLLERERLAGCRLTISTSIVDADFAPCGPADGAFAAICVRDNGPGMTAQVAARAFEPFYTTKDVGKGTGLGLSMVYGTVQSFGGTVRIDTTPGAGTAVILYLRYA